MLRVPEGRPSFVTASQVPGNSGKNTSPLQRTPRVSCRFINCSSPSTILEIHSSRAASWTFRSLAMFPTSSHPRYPRPEDSRVRHLPAEGSCFSRIRDRQAKVAVFGFDVAGKPAQKRAGHEPGEEHSQGPSSEKAAVSRPRAKTHPSRVAAESRQPGP